MGSGWFEPALIYASKQLVWVWVIINKASKQLISLKHLPNFLSYM